MSPILLGAGPLVVYLKRQDQFHDWSVKVLGQAGLPFLTCKAVIVETCFLLRTTQGGPEQVMALLETQSGQIPLQLSPEAASILSLMQRYQSVPMSLADACLVRMTELDQNSTVLTLDSAVLIYRKNKAQMVPLLMPNL